MNWSDKEHVLEKLEFFGSDLIFASRELKDDDEIVMKAVRKYPHSIRYASERLKNNREMVMEAVKSEVLVLQHISWELRSDPSFMNECYQIHGREIRRFAIGELRIQPELYIDYCDVKPAKI